MAFTSVVTRVVPGVGDMIMAYGTYNSAGVTTGTIDTTLGDAVVYWTEPSTVRNGATSAEAAGVITLASLTSGDTGRWCAFRKK